MKTETLSVKKILSIINSCQDQEQIGKCKNVVDNYIKSVKRRGLVNIYELEDRLNNELIQRQEAIYLADMFN